MDDTLCLLVVIGADDTGRKEVLALVDGYRESEASWLEVLSQLTSQGIRVAPELAMGDGALGFWNAVTKHWPRTRHQGCWIHKTANVLNKVPKSVQPRMKESLHDIWMAETRQNAYKAFGQFETRYAPLKLRGCWLLSLRPITESIYAQALHSFAAGAHLQVSWV